ncbi:MAG: beta-ketoacyl-[acyl-carrier-protein] synthase family protein [Pirellulaceae bacterium]
MERARDVVITGTGVVSPLGVGNEKYWAALASRRSGVAQLTKEQGRNKAFQFGAPLVDFDGKQFVTPRKALKVMCLEIQAGYAAASLAMEHAGLAVGTVDPDRLGVVMGTNLYYCHPSALDSAFGGCIVDGEFDFDRWAGHAMSNVYPLWMLKYLPNMAACQIGIAQDARAHNNTITLEEVSGLLAIVESASVIERGWSDVMIAGGSGSRLSLTPMVYRGDVKVSHFEGEPEQASRPFDARRRGLVNGEGAAAIILESRQHAEARGAEILATVLGSGRSYGASFEQAEGFQAGIERSIAWALKSAGVGPGEVGHVVAHGLGTLEDDPPEAKAIRAQLGDAPVTALKSYFGHLGAGSGVVELVGSLLGRAHGEVPVTLNYEQPDPECPINVIHEQPLRPTSSISLALSQSATGQAVALAIGGP